MIEKVTVQYAVPHAYEDVRINITYKDGRIFEGEVPSYPEGKATIEIPNTTNLEENLKLTFVESVFAFDATAGTYQMLLREYLQAGWD